MKGYEIKRENEEPGYLFNRWGVVSAIAHAIYYTVNPQSEMCVPNCAYERAEKEFDDWFTNTRAKKAIETLGVNELVDKCNLKEDEILELRKINIRAKEILKLIAESETYFDILEAKNKAIDFLKEVSE